MGIYDGFKKKVEQKEAVNYEIDTQRTRELYKQIADKVSDIIPDQCGNRGVSFSFHLFNVIFRLLHGTGTCASHEVPYSFLSFLLTLSSYLPSYQ